MSEVAIFDLGEKLVSLIKIPVSLIAQAVFRKSHVTKRWLSQQSDDGSIGSVRIRLSCDGFRGFFHNSYLFG